MSLIGLFSLLDRLPASRDLLDRVKSGQRVQQMEVPDSAKPFLLAAMWHRLEVPMLAIVPRPEEARRLHDELVSYLGPEAPAYLFPEPEVLPFERLVADAGSSNQRMLAMSMLLQARGSGSASDGAMAQAPLIVASTAAVLRKTISAAAMESARHTLEMGMKVSVSQIFSRWVDLGYQREAGVEVPGTFSSRGGIVDIYPPSSDLPARIELLGNEIESIRLFDPASQRSVEAVDRISIVPAREVVPSLSDRDRVSQLIGQLDFSRCTVPARERLENELASLFSGRTDDELSLHSGLLNDGCLIDHLPAHGLLILDREGEIESVAEELTGRAHQLRASRHERGDLPANFPSPQLSWQELQTSYETRQRVTVKRWSGGEEGLDFQPAGSYYGRTPRFAEEVHKSLGEGATVVVVSRSARRLREILEEGGVGTTVLPTLESLPSPASLSLLSGSLREGWALPLETGRVILLTDSEIFGIAKERRSRPRTPVRREAFLSELAPGTHVVHIDHGVARFTGTVSMEADGDQKEYLVLEYAQGDKLYVPTDHLGRVSPYTAPNDQAPSLTRLGTAEWSRVKERVKSSAREMARELLSLYASRHVVEGHAFSVDTPWQQELEDPFPYEETEDQARTIEEVKRDMEQSRPMDRLVCGDVGYGKTEVALRAAFKCVNDGMQVGVLVPTTVLAQQHYATFGARLTPFPVRVEVLSRFRTRKEQQGVIEALKLGTVDIVIGTHRLLQKDVRFKNLGLVVVDEEQRFGVTHKERFKRMRREVDVLTMSATPIPRTLYMGLAGIRDMSTMETPPEERLPVKTYVSESSDDVVKEAILRELERGGQVFFLHNRVHSIHRVAAGLSKLVPQARIAIGHGRMPEADLEEVMYAFADGDIDVLVCTTIIESGLDIPNANTLIIDRADRFGLSQLYQLRGRVGRSGHRAYTYLLIPPRRTITEASQKRLKAILEASELGAGFRIAMRDLEIRGAGNILGSEQSGHIHAVGFDLYSQLLNEAVGELKEQRGQGDGATEAETKTQARVSLRLSAHIPESYIAHLPTRLAIYQRLTGVRSGKEVEDIRDELRDRFGALPDVVENLLYLVDLKLRASDAGVETITMSGPTVTLTLEESVGGARLALEKALGPEARVGNRQVHVSMRSGDERWREDLTAMLGRLLDFKETLLAKEIPA